MVTVCIKMPNAVVLALIGISIGAIGLTLNIYFQQQNAINHAIEESWRDATMRANQFIIEGGKAFVFQSSPTTFNVHIEDMPNISVKVDCSASIVLVRAHTLQNVIAQNLEKMPRCVATHF